MSFSHYNEYLLGHVPGAQETPRLDSQHHRITYGIMKGKLVHESIPIESIDSPVADICCGTGIWLDELSRQLTRPNKIWNYALPQFIGFDVNSSAFRGNDVLAPNVQLVEHDCTRPFSAEYIGKFGLVNMRGLAFAIPRAQFPQLFRNVVSLLKPGGFLQWLDTEPQLWKSLPQSSYFDRARSLVAVERHERSLVPYMPDFMIQECLSVLQRDRVYSASDANSGRQILITHFSLTPGGAARLETASHEDYLNSRFSDTVLETLQLLLEGIRRRMQDGRSRSQTIKLDDEISEIKNLEDFVAEARKSEKLTVCGVFPLLIAQLKI